MSKIKWRIYYGDDTYFEGEPQDAPERDVQIIVQHDDDRGWIMTHANDFYLWNHNRWHGADAVGMYDYLMQPGWKRVLFGRTLPHGKFNEIYYRAKAARNYARDNGKLLEH